MLIHQALLLTQKKLNHNRLFKDLPEFIKYFGIILDTAQKWSIILFPDGQESSVWW